jgi:hypothetical protein
MWRHAAARPGPRSALPLCLFGIESLLLPVAVVYNDFLLCLPSVQYPIQERLHDSVGRHTEPEEETPARERESHMQHMWEARGDEGGAPVREEGQDDDEEGDVKEIKPDRSDLIYEP